MKYAILLDGGFLRKELPYSPGKTRVSAADIVKFAHGISGKPDFAGKTLLRVFYYDSLPWDKGMTHPLDPKLSVPAKSQQAKDDAALIRDLELERDFAVRKGTLQYSGWKLKKSAIKGGVKAIQPYHLKPDLKQKGVDMRIGLDIAWIAIKRIVDELVLVTGDADFIPAMKLARTEGIRVYLETLGCPQVSRELRVHADVVLS